MSGKSEERHMGATVSLNELSIDQLDTGTRPDSDHLQVQWVCHAINDLLPYVSFLPAYLGLKIA